VITTNQVLAKGAVGTGAAGTSLAISLMTQLEVWLRLTALGLGCVVSLATLISLAPKVGAGLAWLRRKFSNKPHPQDPHE
jgi:hypothetical protein